jgi:hypothetical protein
VLELKALLVRRESRVFKESLALELKARLARRELLGPARKARKARKAPQELKAFKESLVLKVRLAPKVLRAFRELQELKVL